MKTLNKIFLLISIALTNGFTHCNGNIYRYLNTASKIGMFAGVIMFIADPFVCDKQDHFVKVFTVRGPTLFSMASLCKTHLMLSKQLTIQEKNYKINQELLAVQTKNLEASQAMLKKLEKKETESEDFHENTK